MTNDQQARSQPIFDATNIFVVGFFVLILTSSFASAENHCTYSLYSSYLKKNFKVCQMATDASKCGAWKVDGKITQMAFAASEAKLEPGLCSLSGMVGTCELPDGDVVFYEGDPAVLEHGCFNMKGLWQPKRLGTAQELLTKRSETSPPIDSGSSRK